MAEPKIVKEIDGSQVGVFPISSGLGITIVDSLGRSHSYTATLDRANATALRDALTAALDKER